MRLKKYVWLILLSLHVGATLTRAQTTATLSGNVYDAANRAPLASVNVFLANTMLGSQTDANGAFTIRNVPFGTHELVVSMLGYEVQRTSVRVTQERVADLGFHLKSKPLFGPEVEVVAEEPSVWKKNLNKFEKMFWGKSRFAGECKLLNAEVLDFAEDGGGWFSAEAGQPLRAENRALGYRLEIILNKFEYNENRNEIRYSVIPRFEELPAKDANEARRWERNRLKAYHGSLRHFLRALVTERTHTEGFKVHTMPQLPWEERVTKHQLVSPERLLAPGDLPTERRLAFEKYLEIEFNSERERTSWMMTTVPSVLMNEAGYVYSGLDIFVYGYWFHQRIAEALPREYVPEE